MKKTFLFFLSCLVYSACSLGETSILNTSSQLYDQKIFSGFSPAEESAWEEKAKQKEQEMFSQSIWNDNDVVELARYYEYSGYSGRTLLLYQEYEKQLQEKEEPLSYAILWNISVAYKQVGDLENAFSYFQKHWEKYGALPSLESMIEISLKQEKLQQAQNLFDLYVEKNGTHTFEKLEKRQQILKSSQ